MTVSLHEPRALWKRSSIGETAEAAAKSIGRKAPTLRQRVLDHLAAGPATPEQLLALIRKDGVFTVLTSIRPRCSELARLGLITDSGKRQPGEGCGAAIVWRVTTDDERAAHAAKVAADE